MILITLMAKVMCIELTIVQVRAIVLICDIDLKLDDG